MKNRAIAQIFFLLLLCCGGFEMAYAKILKVVLISANTEWNVVKQVYTQVKVIHSPFGEYFITNVNAGNSAEKIVFFHGGWGKVAAAGSTQFCIDRWSPEYIINVGTCGGFEGRIKKYETVLVNRTIIYDILEAMGDSTSAINDYATTIDLSWLVGDLPTAVIKTLMVSADRDIIASEIPMLEKKYNAIAADWETGAIAFICSKNKTRLLILRGVSDLVHFQNGGEAYNNESVFVEGTSVVMKKLLHDLPAWMAKCKKFR